MRRVLIIHPEGNINQNPFLATFVKIWGKKYNIDYWCTFSSPKNNNKINIIKKNKTVFRLRHKIISYFPFFLNVFRYFSKLKPNQPWDYIISIDREGVIEGYLVNTSEIVKHVHLSFEIMFTEETSKIFKCAEIKALKKVHKVIIQDEMRAESFCNENAFDERKVDLIPIVYPRLQKKADYRVRDAVGIPSENQVILWQGSLRHWNGVSRLKQLVEFLPKNYSIIIHGRDKIELEYFKKTNEHRSIFISTFEFDTVLDMSPLFAGVKWGIVFYEPQQGNRFLGKNIAEIGMASGKFGNFMRHSIPVIYNGCGSILTQEIEYNKLGISFEKFKSLEMYSSETIHAAYRLRCQDYFERKINYNVYGKFFECT